MLVTLVLHKRLCYGYSVLPTHRTTSRNGSFYRGSCIGDVIQQTKIKSWCKSRIPSNKSAMKKYMWNTHSQSDSIHTGTEWIICLTTCLILSGKGRWWISLTCFWFKWVFKRGQDEKAYFYLACRFYSDRNKHSQAYDVMLMINEAKEKLEDALHHKDAMREQEHVRTAHNYIEISSDSLSSSSSDD